MVETVSRIASPTGRRPVNVLYRAVAIEVITDPSILTEENLSSISENVTNSRFILDAPRNSLIVSLISNAEGVRDKSRILCYPLFPPHLSLPVKPGEQVWVIFETLGTGQNIGYWLSRIPEPNHVDDVNYTHGDRKFSPSGRTRLSEQNSSTSSVPKPDFQNGSDVVGSLTLLDEQASTEPGQPSQLTESGTNIFDRIYQNSISVSSFTAEPVPRFTKRPGDTVLQGSNNTLICLGQDRGFSITPTEQASTSTTSVPTDFLGAGTIDLVAGRGAVPESVTSPIIVENTRGLSETNKDFVRTQQVGAEDNSTYRPNEGDPDFSSDASRIYISMKTNGDENFSLEPYSETTSTEQVPADAFVVSKSNNIRLVARESGTIRVVKEGENRAVIQMEPDGTIIVDGPKVIIGSGSEDQVVIGDGGDQSMLLGDDFLEGLGAFLDSLSTAVGNFGGPLPQINSAATRLRASLESFKSRVTKVK